VGLADKEHGIVERSMTKKLSKREIQRQIRAADELRVAEPSLAPELAALLARYRTAGVGDVQWSAVEPVVAWVMRRAGLSGEQSFEKHLGVVAKYLLWRLESGDPIDVAAAFRFSEVDRYWRHGLDGYSAKTRNDYRSRLLNVSRSVNPGVDAPPRVVGLGRVSLRPPYTAAEEVTIRRAALRQRTEGARQRLCAVVGLAGGAGLQPSDFRVLRGGDIELGDGVSPIVVRVPGEPGRVSVVRREYEPLVRAGVGPLAASALVVGNVEGRTTTPSKVIEKAELFDDVPRIDVGRLRSTWLLWLMTQRVPVQVILSVAGLATARSLAELSEHLPPVELDPVVLCGDGEVSA
jgi:hypothetical protein